MKKSSIIRVLLLVALLPALCVGEAFAAETAAQALNCAAAAITRAKAVSASFSFTSGGQKGSGTLKMSGKKFTYSSPGSSCWYDGRNMWTYNSASRETTLVAPTASELAEANPLSYLASGASGFTCTFSGKPTGQRKVIDMTPKSRKAGVRKVTVTLAGAAMTPQKIVVTSTDGSVSTVTISQLKTLKSLPASDFVYPKKRYPGVKVVDLR